MPLGCRAGKHCPPKMLKVRGFGAARWLALDVSRSQTLNECATDRAEEYMKMTVPKSRGFTLIELMVVVVVIAVLAAIALPSYLAQVRKSRRSDAITTMNTVVLNEERWRTNCPSYATFADSTCTSAGAAFMSQPTSSYYTFALSNVGASAYTVKATAQGGQAKDKQFGVACGTLYYAFGADTTVDSACSLSGTAATAAGNVTQCPAKCWGK